jgi:hypothetical protein
MSEMIAKRIQIQTTKRKISKTSRSRSPKETSANGIKRGLSFGGDWDQGPSSPGALRGDAILVGAELPVKDSYL